MPGGMYVDFSRISARVDETDEGAGPGGEKERSSDVWRAVARGGAPPTHPLPVVIDCRLI